MKSSIRNIIVLLTASAMVAGCNPFKKDAVKTPVVGNRIAVLSGENDIAVDDATAALPFTLPEPVANDDWAQSGGNPSKSMSHVALGASLGTAWTASIGAGSVSVPR